MIKYLKRRVTVKQAFTPKTGLLLSLLLLIEGRSCLCGSPEMIEWTTRFDWAEKHMKNLSTGNTVVSTGTKCNAEWNKFSISSSTTKLSSKQAGRLLSHSCLLPASAQDLDHRWHKYKRYRATKTKSELKKRPFQSYRATAADRFCLATVWPTYKCHLSVCFGKLVLVKVFIFRWNWQNGATSVDMGK